MIDPIITIIIDTITEDNTAMDTTTIEAIDIMVDTITQNTTKETM
jgi:hypothetical protein